ncbi:hypothetical protein [Pedobacter sp. L105]|uniref:hypothetical protein n=1 Tax=Pedobacter sp. L105 TaxID=1641871 RepID=UPI00131CB53B|nr:hypothetical protein [Pedobacter sp. L105]
MDNNLQTNVVINTSINSAGVASGVADVNTALAGMGNGGQFQAANAGVQSFRTQLREAREAVLALGAAGQSGTAAYIQAAQKVADLKNEQLKLNDAVKALDPNNKFAALGSTARLAAASLGALQGTFVLLGASSESAAASIAKLQSISAIIQLFDTFNTAKLTLIPFINNLLSANVAVTSNTVAVAGNAEAIAAQTLITAQATVAQNDLIIAQLGATAAAEAQAIAEAQAEEARLISIGTTSQQVILEQKLTIAKLEGAAATRAEGLATSITTTTTEEASVATTALGLSFKALGIGLIIAAVAYLIANWQELKNTFKEFLPTATATKGAFNELKEVFVGVGSVLINSVISTVKVLIDLVKGDLPAVIDELKKAGDVAGVYAKGVAVEAQNIADDAEKKRLTKLIAANEAIIKERKALGDKAIALERQNFADRKKLAELNEKGNDEDDPNKESKKVEEDRIIFENGLIKKRLDAQKAAAKKLEEQRLAMQKEVDKNVISAQDVIDKAYMGDRDKEDLAIMDKYRKRIADATKIYSATSEEVKTLQDAQATELGENKLKNDKIVDKYLLDEADKFKDEYQKKIDDIYLKANELAKNNPDRAGEIQATATVQVKKIRTEQTLHNTTVTDQATVDDPASDLKTKHDAELKVLADQLAEDLVVKQLSDADKLKAQQKYNEDVYKTNLDYNQKDLALKQAQKDAEQKLQDTKFEIANEGLEILGGLFGKNKALADTLFAVEKGLAIAQIVTGAAASIAKQSASLAAIPTILPESAVLGVPIPNPAYLVAAASTAASITQTKVSAALGIATIGAATVSKFMSGSGSVGSTTSATPAVNYSAAPTITSNAASGTDVQKVQLVGDTPLKAYITNKELKNTMDVAAFNANLTNV